MARNMIDLVLKKYNFIIVHNIDCLYLFLKPHFKHRMLPRHKLSAAEQKDSPTLEQSRRYNRNSHVLSQPL